MPWKLFFFVICIVLITCFIGFNLENACTISFGFTHIPDVPIFISLAIAFAAGIVLTVPFMVSRRPHPSKEERRQAALEAKAAKKAARRQKRRPASRAQTAMTAAAPQDDRHGTQTDIMP